MNNLHGLLTAAAIAMLACAACSSGNSGSSGTIPISGATGVAGGGGQAPGTGGGAGGIGGAPGSGVAVFTGTVCGDLQLAGPETIAAGETVTLCAGTRLTAASPDAGITVLGTLIVAGTAAAPVRLVGQGNPGDWAGIDVQRGGTLTATYLEIHDAAVAVSSRTGASFDIDHLLVDNSSQMLVIASPGRLAHGTLHGLGANQGGTPVFIDDGSPHITDTVIDRGAYGAVDMIVSLGAASAPVFDRVEVADSHCAFHLNESTGAVISNSFIHHNAYGFMVVESADGHVVHNNFEDNAINIGTCAPAASLEVKDNYFAGGPFDDSCPQLSVTGTTPPGAYTSGVGPSP